MKLTGELKKQVEKAESREAARETIANAGMLLSDDELDQVSGGRKKRGMGPASGPAQNNSNDGGGQSGGCGEINGNFGEPQCDCSGEKVNMILTGTDSGGRITYYQCPLCRATETVYG